MLLEKINVKEIRTKYQSLDMNLPGWGDDTQKLLKILTNKINEIIDVLNKKEEWKNDNYGSIIAKKMGHLMDVEEKKQLVGTNWNVTALDKDWEKEFDEEFTYGLDEHLPQRGNYLISNNSKLEKTEEVKQFIRNLLK